MGGRLWLVIGGAVGVAAGLGKVPYVTGAAFALAATGLRIVQTAGLTVVHDLADHGAPRRAVLGVAAVVALVVPGITAWALVVAARTVLRLRAVVALAVVAIGVASAVYVPAGDAAGVVALAVVLGGIAVLATGPLLAAPLAAVAGLLAAVYLPALLDGHRLPTGTVDDLHLALVGSAGHPTWAQVLALVVAIVPFVAAVRRVARS
jgi:hypothetical protein